MSDRPKSAMIFAAGFGTRMGALTKTTPKPMIPVAGRPMVDYPINWAKDAGIRTITVNTHYLADKLAPHLAKQGVTIQHEAPNILDTGGGLIAALPTLEKGPVITLNSDAMLAGPNPVKILLDQWRSDMNALLLLVPKSHALTPREKADFSLKQGKIGRLGDYFFIGAQIIRPDRLREIEGTNFSLNKYWDLLAKSSPLNGTIYPGKWCDVGTQEGLHMAEKMLADV